MMNCAKAIKLLYRVENPEVVQLFGRDTDKLERELERRKFKFVFSMLLCNIIRSSTLLKARMPSSCYVPILIRRFLVLALVGMIGFFEFLVCQIYFSLDLRRKIAYSRPTFFLFFFFSFCSGSLNSGMDLMQCLV